MTGERVRRVALVALAGIVVVLAALGGAVVAEATDSGLGCAPIRQNGAVGIRGDNDNFSVENFTVRSS